MNVNTTSFILFAEVSLCKRNAFLCVIDTLSIPWTPSNPNLNPTFLPSISLDSTPPFSVSSCGCGESIGIVTV